MAGFFLNCRGRAYLPGDWNVTQLAGRRPENSKALCLGVLPTLVNRLEAVAVGIENVSGIVARIVVQARAGLAVIRRASRHRCVVERIHLGLALGDKADMGSPGVRIALSQPEEDATVSSKALEVGMSFGAILTVVIGGMHDTERLESSLVKGNRSIEIFDGYEDVVEQESTSFVNRNTGHRVGATSMEARVSASLTPS